MSRAVIAKRKEDREEKKQRRIDNLKRAEENRKKNEIVQVVSVIDAREISNSVQNLLIVIVFVFVFFFR